MICGYYNCRKESLLPEGIYSMYYRFFPYSVMMASTTNLKEINIKKKGLSKKWLIYSLTVTILPDFYEFFKL